MTQNHFRFSNNVSTPSQPPTESTAAVAIAERTALCSCFLCPPHSACQTDCQLKLPNVPSKRHTITTSFAWLAVLAIALLGCSSGNDVPNSSKKQAEENGKQEPTFVELARACGSEIRSEANEAKSTLVSRGEATVHRLVPLLLTWKHNQALFGKVEIRNLAGLGQVETLGQKGNRVMAGCLDVLASIGRPSVVPLRTALTDENAFAGMAVHLALIQPVEAETIKALVAAVRQTSNPKVQLGKWILLWF